MRTIAEIKKVMTDQIMSNAEFAEKLNLNREESWDSQTSAVSLINIILFVVAAGQYALEWMFEQFKSDVDARIAAAYPGSVSWLWNRAMEYQDDADANTYFAAHGSYESVDESKQIIKHAAVVEKYNTVTIKVCKEGYSALSETEKDAFEAYMNTLKFAGVHLNISSIDSDDMDVTVRVWRNRLIMPEEKDDAIREAVVAYLDGIRYGGTFNKTKLIDAIQQVNGVEDVTIESCVFNAHDANETETTLDTQNYEAIAGHITLANLTVNYE